MNTISEVASSNFNRALSSTFQPTLFYFIPRKFSIRNLQNQQLFLENLLFFIYFLAFRCDVDKFPNTVTMLEYFHLVVLKLCLQYSFSFSCGCYSILMLIFCDRLYFLFICFSSQSSHKHTKSMAKKKIKAFFHFSSSSWFLILH